MPKVSGQYNLPPGYLATSGTTIQSSQHNTPLEDIAQALTGDLPRDGSAAMTGNFNMGSQRITNLATGTQPTDAARVDQLATSDGNLSSLSGLDFQVNRGIYTTAANTAALYVLTPLARTFAEQSTAAGQRGVMGLGTAAEVDVIDEDDMVSDSATRPPSQQSVKAYVDASGLTFQQSGNLTLAGSGVPWVHGNGLGLPKFFGAKIVCNTTDRGYAVGDTVNLCDREGDGSRPLAVVAESTTITLENSGSIFLIAKGSTTDAAITFASWDLILWGVW